MNLEDAIKATGAIPYQDGYAAPCPRCGHGMSFAPDGNGRPIFDCPIGRCRHEDIVRALTAVGDNGDGRARPAAPTATATKPPTRSAARFRPFPLDLCPDVLRDFIHETAAALGTDPTFVAMPALAVCGSAIGTTRAIELKRSWIEVPVVWAAVVARSGTIKSPAMDAATQPLRDAQVHALREQEGDLRRYEDDLADYLEATKSRKQKTERLRRPERPVCRRYLVSDVTTEALVPVLEGNPRGVLCACDELAGWVRRFDAYKKTGGGDAQRWLELWRAGTLIVDRKGGERSTAFVRRAAASVCGTIQPGILQDVLTQDLFESGLAARLLLVQPPERRKVWSDRSPPTRVVGAYANRIIELLSLGPDEGEYGPEPHRLPLAEEARAAWAAWFDRHAARIHNADTDAEAAAFAKIEAYAARLALIFALVADPGAVTVSADALARGTALADWLADEASRVYGMFAADDDDADRRRLVAWIEGQGGSTTLRDLTHGPRRYRDDPDAAKAALNDLAASGLGSWAYPAPGPGGGRPAERFGLKPAPSGTITPADGTETRGIGTGATSATAADTICDEGGPEPVVLPFRPMDETDRAVMAARDEAGTIPF